MNYKEEITKLWQQKEFSNPTDIQHLVEAPIAQGESLVINSPTGTGKTLAYLLPILNRMEGNRELQTLIIAPSQELVKQIGDVAKEWATPLGINTQTIIGGANIKRQIEALKDKPELIVASPGRLLELIKETKKVKLHQVKTVVFDEADYLLTEDSTDIIKELGHRLMRDTQYIWASATYPESLAFFVESLEGEVKLYQTKNDETHANTKHIYIKATNREKADILRQLAHIDNMQAIVFFEQMNQIEQVGARLTYNNIRVGTLQSGVSKFERETSIRLFSQKELTYLLTTDVASRGLDIDTVPYVIHYNRIENLNTYVHRSGRTGRMGAPGTVISLVNEQELRDLQDILGDDYYLEEGVLYKGQLLKPSEQVVLAKEQPKRHQKMRNTQLKKNKKRSNKAKRGN